MNDTADNVDDQTPEPGSAAAEGQSVAPAEDTAGAVVTDAATPEAGLPGAGANVGLIMDIPVTVSMELGRTKMSIKDLLAMNPGSVIELERLASEPMEILVNGTLVAHGEAVRVGERYGVRLTSVITAGERLQKVNGL